jgi:hypothetical protein
MLGNVQLAGVPIREEDVLEIAWVLRDGGFEELALRLEDAVRLETKVLALTIPEWEMILRMLDDPPTAALAELRGVLVREHEWSVREGSSSADSSIRAGDVRTASSDAP